ncbi:hypothetical protein Pint_20608 [Pistacia integerrima]|uniref:Uncharacterized protein n=1 Tax=Pistacia integerrima TaxID=434235 RepID=A0ACC0XG00_9ROSI|nr:hypothetical protein Pint_20608 [Pistacia integerrima]
MVQGRSALYYMNMLGISVEGRRLNINLGVFRLYPNGTGGFALDSGSPQSYLAEPACRILKEELVQHFRRCYGWQLMRNYRVKLCYIHPPRGRNYPLPSITFHFKGANFTIGP